MRKEKAPYYSIVVPIHNEEESIIPLFAKIVETMEAQEWDFEIVFVDDASTDGSFVLLEQIATLDSRVVVVQLRRNFGQTPALAAGFDYARGEVIVSMDGDFQHDPADLPILIEKMQQGYDIVSGWRKQRTDNFLTRRVPSAIANWAMRVLSGVRLHDFGTTFKAYRREVLRGVNLYGELHRFIPALASLQGARMTEVPIRNTVRTTGRSHYGLGRTFRVLFDLLTVRFLLRYLTRPLHFFGMLSLVCFSLGSGALAYLLYEKLLGHSIFLEHGPLLLMAVVAVLAGVQLISTGLIGEILTRVYFEGQQRRIYAVSRVIGRSRKAGIV
ncbi:MAG: glycosyl transferase [Acidobacteria bacterium RIFCSPLOWO2_12_FULL_60_22]|nr:MAG: glycosyl transferase [Acidobacteria bacterium RIFCSPLOWO2_12_FULL_60_22]